MNVFTAESKVEDGGAAAKALVTQLQDKGAGGDVKVIFVFSSTTQSLAAVQSGLKATFADAQVIGATTSGEFTGGHVGKGTVVAAAVAGDIAVEVGMATDLSSDVEKAVSRAVASLPKAPADGYAHRTGIVLVDPLSGFGEEAALLAEVLLGGDVPLAGGAAGDDLKMSCAAVGLDGEVASDAIVVAHISSHVPLAIGVAHGHRPISPPLTITKAEGATIHEVDGRPAWDVWREHTREEAAKQGIDVDNLTPEQEGGYLLRFEAGLAMGDEWKVRAPLSRDENGALSLATAIPQGAVIRITESTPDRQIDSARLAAENAKKQLGDRECAGAIVFDCICRNLILGDAFDDAVGAIQQTLGGAPLAGFETYGEIALATQDLSAFHNTTTVLLAFPKADEKEAG